jgi:hypothetical protein
MEVSDYDDAIAVPRPNHDFASAEELISDLTALLDAGLVVVQEQVLGPARYGVAPLPDRHSGIRKAPGPRPGRHHARVT